MRVRRRTAAWVCVLTFLVAVAGALALLLRPERLAALLRDQLQGLVREGIEVEVGSARPRDGLEATDIVLRQASTRRELLRIGRLHADTRLLQLIQRGKITDFEVFDAVVSLERDADGAFPLLEAFHPGKGPGAGTPRVTVHGGTVRFSDPTVLAPGTTLAVAVKELVLVESRQGRPASFHGTLEEALLGPIEVAGTVTPGAGQFDLRVEVRSFEIKKALHERLGGKPREFLDAFEVKGDLGPPRVAGHGGPAEADRPGLRLQLGRKSAKEPLVLSGEVRPAGLSLLFKGFRGERGFPLPIDDVRGDMALTPDNHIEIGELRARCGDAALVLSGRLGPLDADMGGEGTVGIRGLVLDEKLRNALPADVQRVWDAYGLGGTVDILKEFTRISKGEGAGKPLGLKVVADLRAGVVSYRGYEGPGGVRRGFDYPLKDVTGRLTVEADADSSCVTLARVEGRHGDVRVSARGTVKEFGPGRADVEVHVEAEEVPLDDDIRRAFGPRAPELFDRWGPQGIARRIHVLVTQDRDLDLDRGAYERVTIDMDGRASFCYDRFPLRLHEVAGTVQDGRVRAGSALVPNTTLQGVRGRNGPATLRVDGWIEGEGDAALSLAIAAEDIPLDGALEDAIRRSELGKNAVPVWDRLRPGGRADLHATVSGTDRRSRLVVRADLRGASVQGWDRIRVPVTGLEGRVGVAPEAITIEGVRGRGTDGEVRIEGKVLGPDGDSRLDLVIEADDFAMDEGLRPRLGAAGERAAGFFDFVHPQDGFRADARILLRGPSGNPGAEVELDRIRGGIAPLGVRNLDLGGGRAFYAGDLVTLEGLEGSMAGREFGVKAGRLDLAKGEGDLSIEVRRLRFPADLAGIIPEDTAASIERLAPRRYFHVPDLRVALSEGWRRVECSGMVTLSPQQQGASPGLGIEGEFGLERVTFLRGREPGAPTALSGTIRFRNGVLVPGLRLDHIEADLSMSGTLGAERNEVRADVDGLSLVAYDRRLKDARCRLTLLDGALSLEGLEGTFAGGTLRGTFHAGQEKPAYRGSLELTGADARPLIAPTDPSSRIEGVVAGAVRFWNEAGNPGGLEGNGRFDLSNGRLTEVSGLFTGIARFFAIDPPAFREGRLEFKIKGDELKIGPKGLFLDSSVLTLESSKPSSIWLDGRVNLWLDPDLKVSPLRIPGLNILKILVWNPIFRRVAQIRVKGTLADAVVGFALLPDIARSDSRDLVPPPHATEASHLPPIDY